MSGILAVGPMFVREVCPRQLLTQPRKTENGATCLPIPVWGVTATIAIAAAINYSLFLKRQFWAWV
nr:unnamed protein product [Macaca fascicularis]